MKDDSTLRLEQGSEQLGSRKVRAIRWLGPGAPATYLILDAPRFSLGRGANATVLLDSAGVSRLHAEIYRQGPIYSLRDLGSTNGTHVNGTRVEHAALAEGDVLRLGDMVGVLVRVSADAEAREPDWVEVTQGALFGPAMLDHLAQLRRVAPSNLPVVLIGETGTGKDCLAQAVHALSGRTGPFHAVNCAALPVGLAEAELFGHRKGAFTGADQAHPGHLRAAHRGTLFLDELADLAAPIQAKLLRTLQDGLVLPLGDTLLTRVDVRVVVASQQALQVLVAENRIRADLAARLDGCALVLPPLRERGAEIGLWFQHFLRKYSGGRPPSVESRLLERVLLFDWPANVRELELFTRKLLVNHGHEPILKLAFLPEELRGPPSVEPGTPSPSLEAKDRDEHDLKRFLEQLQQPNGNVARAAASCGISRQRAYRLLKRSRAKAPQESSPVDAELGEPPAGSEIGYALRRE